MAAELAYVVGGEPADPALRPDGDEEGLSAVRDGGDPMAGAGGRRGDVELPLDPAAPGGGKK